MVFLSNVLNIIVRKPDRFWKIRRTMRLTAHYFGRRRNCYSIAIRQMERALKHSRFSRDVRRRSMLQLWLQRLESGCAEHGARWCHLQHGAMRCGLELNRHMLADLAVWEPRTFGALVNVSMAKLYDDLGSEPRPYDVEEVFVRPEGVVPRGTL